jgi:hypothetical protein
MDEADRSSDAGGEVATSALLPSQISASGERRPIWLLVAAHVVFGLIFSFWSAAQGRLPIALDALLVVPVFGLTFAQASLLGFWAAFSPAAWWIRLAGLVGGVVYLEIIFAIGLPGEPSLLVTMTTVGIAAVFGVVHWRYARLECFPQHVSLTVQEGLKFSIRGLMILTFVAAVVLVGIRTLRENALTERPLLFVAAWSLCFAVVGMAAVWGGLGLARPLPRNAVVLLLSAVLGLLIIYSYDSGEPQSYFYSVSVMILQAAVLMASLLIVRSCGYRLVRRPVTEVKLRNETEQISLGHQRDFVATDTISRKFY